MAEELERRLAEWRDAGLITAEQVDRILEREGRSPAPRARSSALAEILGYLGGSLALVAAIILVSRFWDEFSVTVRLGIVGGTTLLVGLAAALLARRPAPAILRLSDFLFVLATIGLAAFVALFCGEILEVSDRALAVATASSAAAASAVFWWLRRSPIRHAALFASLVAAGMTSLALLEGLEVEYFGFALWAIGIAWGLLAHAGVAPPREVGYLLAAIALVIGSQMLAGEGQDLGLVLALVTVAGLIGAGVFLDSVVVLGIGTLGVFITVPRAMFSWFGDAAGGAVALLVTGLLLLGVAVGINKVGRQLMRSSRERRDREPRRVLPIGGRTLLVATAVAVLVLVLGFIVFLGYTPPPSYPPVPTGSAMPGTIAFLRYENDQDCLFTMPVGGGTEHRVACQRGLGGPVAWTADGDLVVISWDPDMRLEVFDPVDGTLVTTVGPSGEAERQMYERAESRTRRPDGATLVTVMPEDLEADRVAAIEIHRTGQPATTVLSVTGPRSYGFWDLQWSPDGQWVLASDSLGRTIVVSADGSIGPFLVVRDASAPAWFIPGNATYTFDLPD